MFMFWLAGTGIHSVPAAGVPPVSAGLTWDNTGISACMNQDWKI